MKKVISLAIVLSFLLQMNIPLISFATNEKEVDPTPDTIINLDEHIKHELINRHNDKNGDGEFSIEELSNVYFLAVDCDDCDVDFSGIEHMTNLSTLYLARTTENMDYAKLSELPLDTLGISGFLNDFSFLESLPRLVELKISLFNDANPFDVISRLNEDVSWINDITGLNSLALEYNRDGIELSKLK